MRGKLVWFPVLLWLIGAFCGNGLAAVDGPLDVGEQAVASSTSKIDAFKTALAKDGFVIKEWPYKSVDVAWLVCNKFLKTGYANNAGATYLSIT